MAHVHVAHAMFVQAMHVAAGGMLSTGVLSALGGFTYQKCTYKQTEWASSPKVAVTSPKADVSPRPKATSPAAAREEVDEALKRAEEEEEEEEWGQGLELTSWILNGAVVGCVGGLAVAGPWVHFYHAAPWHVAWAAAGKASGFFAPPVLSYVLLGPEKVARNLPTAIGISVGLSAAGALAVIPVSHLMHHPTAALYYIAALRIVACSGASIMTAVFAQRYAAVQRSKRPDPARASKATNFMDGLAIFTGQIAGTAVAGCWGYVALTEWAGSEYPHWMSELPEVYFLAVVVHLLAPSKDHDQRASTLMARSGLVALHAILFIPSLHHIEIAHKCQLIVGQALTAGWFGTFAGEWITTPKHVGGGDHTHEDHEAGEHAETGAMSADTFAHIAKAL
eukprot:Hpha_TRINITY_DN15651_c5_g2::TRINITY_DN15651_c5_g2_i1::g.100518::m.100518